MGGVKGPTGQVPDVRLYKQTGPPSYPIRDELGNVRFRESLVGALIDRRNVNPL